MNRTINIIIASSIALVVLLIITYIINLNNNKTFVNIAVANETINEGKSLTVDNITWVRIDAKSINLNNYITEINLSKMSEFVLNQELPEGHVVWKKDLVNRTEYLEKIDGFEYIALPVKSATDGVCYKIKDGDRISVYYTAKKKLVDEVLKDKKKIYSALNSETLVTCLLYENIEIIAMTNNIGQDTNGTPVTDIVVRLTEEDALLLANLKEQGTFTLSVK